MKSYKELTIEMEAALAAITDEWELTKAKIEWNSIIMKAWKAERAAKNSLTIDEIRERFVGRKHIFHSEISGYQWRVVKEDKDGFYITWFKDKMVVEHDAVYDKMEMKYIRG